MSGLTPCSWLRPPYPYARQRGWEFPTWIALCRAFGVSRYVELGRLHGWTAQYAFDAGFQVVSVDLLDQRGEEFSVERAGRTLPAGSVHYGDSHDSLLRDRILDYFGGRVDAVFVDADHSKDAVRADVQCWWTATRILLGFHDCLDYGSGHVWRDLARRFPSVEIRSRDEEGEREWGKDGDGGGGIGVLIFPAPEFTTTTSPF